MKTQVLRKQVFIRILLLSLFVYTQTGVKAGSFIQERNKTYIKVMVNGMACPFCAYGLEKNIKKIKGAGDIFVDINEGFITFSVHSGNKPTEDELKKTLKEAGFSAGKIEYAQKPFEIKKKNEKPEN